jgi:alpha-tubulin suppressor-like RCC1 family protein
MAGATHTIAIKTDNTIWGWGANTVYQLGLGDTNNRITPFQIGTNSDWIIAATKASHTIARKSDGTIWGWGSNNFGQLGLGYAVYSVTEPTPIGINSDWSVITVGADHSLALRTNGTLWIWGRNNYGQLGLGDTIDRNAPMLIGE